MELDIVVESSLQSIYNLLASIYDEAVSGRRLLMRVDCEEGEEEEEGGGEEKGREKGDELGNVREEEEEICKIEGVRDYYGEEREEVSYEEVLEMVEDVGGRVLGHFFFGFLGVRAVERIRG